MGGILILLLMIGSVSLSDIGGAPWQTGTESGLIEQFTQLSKDPVFDIFLDDFTGDGTSCAFVFIGAQKGNSSRASFRGALWYIDEYGCCLLKGDIETDRYEPVILKHGEEKHLLLTVSSNMPGNAESYIWMVREHKPELILQTANFCFPDNGQLAIVRTFISASGSGRVWQRYYLYWDSEKQSYQEYMGSVIAEEEFFLYENAREIKEKVESIIKEDISCHEPDKVQKIETDYIKRDNGIFNINYTVYCGDQIYYRYAILREKDGVVTLEKSDNYDTYEWGYISEYGDFGL